MKSLVDELIDCGLKRMTMLALAKKYDDNQTMLISDLRWALGLKSLKVNEIGKIGRLLKRAMDGDFHNGNKWAERPGHGG